MKSKKGTGIAYVCLLITFFCWGSVYVANRYILQALEPTELACLRFIVSSLSLGIMVLVGKEKIHIQKSDWKYLIFIGFMGYYLSMECTLLSVDYAGASLASLINSLNPVFITLFAAFFLKEKLTPQKLICLAIALVGVLIVSGGAQGGGKVIGIVYGIGSILTWAWTAMYARRLSARYSALVITFLGITISLVFHIPTAAVTVAQHGLPHISPVIVVCILYSGICGTAIPQFLWNFALSRLEASTCSMFYPLMPIFSAILGVALLGETLGLNFFIGGALIISTILLQSIHTKPGEPHKVHKSA